MPIEDFYYGGGQATIDEEDGMLAKLAKSVVLPPLTWLSQTMDKPGRAVRGLLDGSPSELLNLIPLSDTLGITDPEKSVSGRDLLRNKGMIGEEDNWGNFLGGLATEILLDPVNLITLGASSSLTALGRTAKLAGTIEKTWAGRIGATQAGVHAPQAGLLGVRTPWWAEAMGVPAASKQFMTGPASQYMAGQMFKDARSLVDKIPYVGPSVGRAGDKIQAMMQSMFVPGAGITMDPRITNTMANTVEDATAAARAATLDTRMAAFDPRVQASELLTQYGVKGPAAEDTIGRYFNAAIEKTVGLYNPQQVHLYPPGDLEAARYAEHMGTFAQPYGKVGMEDKLQQLAEAMAAPTRQTIDKARDLAIQGGFKVGDNPNPWGLDYNPRQSQESGVTKGAATRSRKIPQSPLWGGTNQFDDLLNTSASAGIANQPIPAGVTPRQWNRRINKMQEPEIQAHLDQAKAFRDAKYGKAPEPSVAEMATESANTSVKAGRVGSNIEEVAAKPSGITLESFINNIDEAGKSVATPQFAKSLRDLAPHLDEVAFGKAVSSLDESLSSLGKKELRAIAKEIGAAGADPTLGVTAKDNIIMKIMEAKNATPTQVAKEVPTSIPAQVKEVAQATEPVKLPYPIELSDANLEKDTRKLFKVIAKASPEVVEAKRGFYRNDVLGATEHYTRNMAEQAGKGQGLLTAIADNVVPFEATKANPNEFISVHELLKKMKLTGQDVSAGGEVGQRLYTQGAKNTLLDKLAEKGKTTLNANGDGISAKLANNELKKHFVSKDLAENLVKEAEGPGFNPWGRVLEKIRDITNATRTWLTQPWVPFHTRNTWEGAIQSKLAGGLDTAVVRDVVDYKAGTLTDPAKIAEMHKYANEVFNTGAAFRHQVTENMGDSVVGKASKVTTPFVEQAGSTTIEKYGGTVSFPNQAATPLETIKGFLEGYKPSVAASRGEKYLTLNPKESVFVQQGLRASEAADDVQRMSMFISLRKQGYAPQAAADAVTAAHLDYSKLTPFEKQLRSLVPFYSFSKGNIARTAAQMGDPGAISSLLRATTEAGNEGFVPSYVSQGTAVPIPGAEDGKQRFISGLSTPFDDELMGSLLSLMSGSPLDASRRAMSTINPLGKLGITAGTGRQLYSGRKLDEFTPNGITSFLPNYPGNVIAEAIGATPLGRLATTANSVVGGRDQNLLLKLITGIRTTDIDPAMATQMAAKDAVSTLLKRTGMVNTSENLYPKQEFRDVENQPEQLQMLLQLLKAVQATGKDMREQRQQP